MSGICGQSESAHLTTTAVWSTEARKASAMRMRLGYRASIGPDRGALKQTHLALGEGERDPGHLARIIHASGQLAPDLEPLAELVPPCSQLEIDRAVAESREERPGGRVPKHLGTC